MIHLTLSKVLAEQQVRIAKPIRLLPATATPKPQINYTPLLPDQSLSQLDDVEQVQEPAERFELWSQQTETLLARLHGLEAKEWDAGRGAAAKF
eukprot:3345151-Amphidinium_carterae.1